MPVDLVALNSLSEEIMDCQRCDRQNYRGLGIDEKQFGMMYSYPNTVPIDVLFVAESPPKPGNGFFYNEQLPSRFRNILFGYLNESGLGPVASIAEFTAKKYYLADAMNCRWDKSEQQNIPKKVFMNCREYLRRQIFLFQPRIIVCMGNAATESIEAMTGIDFVEYTVKMSFIMTAPNETREDRKAKLRVVANALRSYRGGCTC